MSQSIDFREQSVGASLATTTSRIDSELQTAQALETQRGSAASDGQTTRENAPVTDRHNNITDTVFLRAEAISEAEMKAITLAQYFGEFLAVAVLTVEVVLKFVMNDRTYLLSKAAQWWNLAASVSCLAALLACMAVLAVRVVRYHDKVWGRRRKVILTYAVAEACLVVVNLICISIANVYVLVIDCTWFSMLVRACAFVMWTTWNTLFMVFLIEVRNTTFWKRKGKLLRRHGRDRLLLDAPIWVHSWVLLNWVAFEAITISLLAINTTGYEDRFKPLAKGRCNQFNYNCKLKPVTLTLLVVSVAAWLMWIVLWLACVYQALDALHRRPWHKYKMANINIRVQIRSRLICIIMFALCVVLLVFVKSNSCASYSQTWLGLTPLTFVTSTMAVSTMYFYMPTAPELVKPMVQSTLQVFAWSEGQKEDRLEKRNEKLKLLKEEACQQPLFCFETAVKLFYFSALTYEYQEDKAASLGNRRPANPSVQGYKIEKAVELYNLERFELIVKPAEDTKVLVCWNADTIVLTFRGTASMTNVLADLQVWMSPHPPVRGRMWNRPKAHAGFLKAWTANGLHQRLLSRLKSILESPGADLKAMQILVTGHSLGGALATLAAYDIAQEFSGTLTADQVACYTFGAPRTGNHSFAKDYNSVVPDTWHVINARDIVPQSGKFIHSYKRPGQRVVINRMGDMLVRPAFVEISASQNYLPFQSSVPDHYLASYQASLIAICSAQFGDKAFKDGVEGMRNLISSGQVHDVLSQGSLDEKKLQRLAGFGGLALFQLTGQVQKGVSMLQLGAVGEFGKSTIMPKPTASKLRCHDGVCWTEDACSSGGVLNATAGPEPPKAHVRPLARQRLQSRRHISAPTGPLSPTTSRKEAFSEGSSGNRDLELGTHFTDGLDVQATAPLCPSTSTNAGPSQNGTSVGNGRPLVDKSHPGSVAHSQPKSSALHSSQGSICGNEEQPLSVAELPWSRDNKDVHALGGAQQRDQYDGLESQSIHTSRALSSSRNNHAAVAHQGGQENATGPDLDKLLSSFAQQSSRKRLRLAADSQRSLGSSSLSSWKSATLEDKLHLMEERGLLSEVLGEEERLREAHQGILPHRWRHQFLTTGRKEGGDSSANVQSLGRATTSPPRQKTRQGIRHSTTL